MICKHWQSNLFKIFFTMDERVGIVIVITFIVMCVLISYDLNSEWNQLNLLISARSASKEPKAAMALAQLNQFALNNITCIMNYEFIVIPNFLKIVLLI